MTPEEISEDVYACWKAGAAIAHLHMRDDEGHGTMDKEKFRETIKLIRSHKDCDVIINCTSSGASPEHPATDDERMAHHRELSGIEMGSYDAGSFNWMPGGVFVNSPQFLEKLGDLYMEKGIKPELEIFDAGMLGVASYFVKKGHLSTPCHYQFCLGVLGDYAQLHPLLALGIIDVAVGAAALLLRKRQDPFDRAAEMLLAKGTAQEGLAEVRLTFSPEGMYITQAGEERSRVPYTAFEVVLETQELLLPVCEDTITILQKRDLITGTFPQLQEFLAGQVPYVTM